MSRARKAPVMSSAKRRKVEAAAALALVESGACRQIEFTLEGVPVPKGRPRFGKGTVRTPTKTRKYESNINAAAKIAVMRVRDWPKTAPFYSVSVWAYFPDYQTADIDNVVKAVCDGMEGVAYDNDRRVWDGERHRRIDKGRPRTEVRVEWREAVDAVNAARGEM